MNMWKLSILTLAGVAATAIGVGASGCTITSSSSGVDGGDFQGTDGGTGSETSTHDSSTDGGTEGGVLCGATKTCPGMTVPVGDCPCNECVATKCCAQAGACFGDAECNALAVCIDDCANNDAGLDAGDCANACATAHSAGVNAYNALVDCASGGDGGAGCKAQCGF